MPRFIAAMLAALALLPAAVQGAPPRGCPPLGALPDFIADDARLRTWEPLTFLRKADGADAEETEVEQAGSSCAVSYHLKEGADTPSNLEIQSNYRQQLEGMGAQVHASGGRNTYARLAKDGAETWFRIYSEETAIELTVLRVQPPRLTLLPPSGNDYALLGHMPGFAAAKPVTRNFDAMNLAVVQDGEEKEVAVQGRTVFVSYEDKSGNAPTSDAEIQWNYRTALTALGAELMHQSGHDTTARLLRNGQVIWLRVYSSETSVEVYAVEEKPFEPTIKPAQAQLQTALERTGRVTLYVNFDFDRATLRPEAAPVVAQVAAMLKADPKLRLTIEGHTDALGTADRNRALSAERAASFAAALTAQGIGADRLSSAGFGPDKPVATNDTSEGRARNRRVELVRM